MSFVISGQVREFESGQGVPHVYIEAWDKDLFFDDKLGACWTDSGGRFRISYSEADFRELFEQGPDIYLKVFAANGVELQSTERHVRCESGKEERFDIEIPKEKIVAIDYARQHDTFGRRLGLIYKRWVLDCIPRLGYAVSLDFSHRPELYKQVDAKIAQLLTDIQSQYGYAPNFPNDDIRQMLMRPIFGESDSHLSGNNGTAFQTARMPVFAAAAGFAENAQATSFPMHRERIRSAIVPLRSFLEDLEGSSLDQTDRRMASVFATAAALLKDPGVASVFGINAPIPEAWPLDSTDPEGAKLVESITTQLPDMPYGVISRDRFVRMQRIGETGLRSIAGVLATNIETDDDALDRLISQLYAWGSDLGLIGGARPQQG